MINRAIKSTSPFILQKCNKLFFSSKISTLRVEERDFFNKSASEWWDPEGDIKPLHRMNPLRVKYICDKLKECNNQVLNNPIDLPLKGLHAMDVGCGAGLLTESLSKLGANVIGLDPAKDNIMMAISHANKNPQLSENINNKSLEYKDLTIESFVTDNQNKQLFDLICSLEVIEHVDNPKQFIDLMTSVLKPGGSIFISTFNKTINSYLIGILCYEYIFRMVPVGTHHWNQFISLNDVKNQFSLNNCNTINTIGLFCNPIKCEWSLVDNKSVSYIIHAIKK